jgi:hypothetical protein
VLGPDGHGGFTGATSKGEWTLSPADRHGVRELAFAPVERETPMVKYVLGNPQGAMISPLGWTTTPRGSAGGAGARSPFPKAARPVGVQRNARTHPSCNSAAVKPRS